MGTAAVSVVIFLMFSLGVSWFAGDKEKGRLEKKLVDEKTTEKRLEKEIAGLKERSAKDAARLREIEDRLKAELSEKRRLERALAIEERQRMILEEQGAGKGGVAVMDMDKERQKIREEIEAKTKQEIFALEARVKLLEEEKVRMEEESRKKTEEAMAASVSARSAARDLEIRLKETEAAKAAVEETLQARLREMEAAKVAVEETLQARLRETEAAKVAVEETLRAREAAYVQAKAMMTEAGKDSYKSQVTSIESRLVSLEENKKGIEDKWSEAMVAIVKLDETAQRIEAGMLKGADGQVVGVLPLEGGQKAQADMESLKQARENVRIAMESVRGALQSSMEAETQRMKAEISQISESLDRISVKGRAAGFDKAAVGVEAAAPAGMVTLGAAGLKEAAISIKGPDAVTPLKTEKLEPRTEVAALNQKLEGLNVAIDEAFKSSESVVDAAPAAGVLSLPATQQCPAVACPEIKPLECPAVAACPEIKPAETLVVAACPEIKPLECPAVAAKESSVAEAQDNAFDRYIVRKGDSLWRIASKKEVYGNPLMWPLLYKYNLANIFNPDIIRINLELSVLKNPAESEKKGAIDKARKHSSGRGKKGYIKRMRREFQNEFLQRG